MVIKFFSLDIGFFIATIFAKVKFYQDYWSNFEIKVSKA
jgi:hypothetical protein